MITPEKNLRLCLGACQVGGSVIDWVMKAEGISFKHAVEWLRGDMQSPAATSNAGRPSIGAVTKKSTTSKLPAFLAADSDDQAVLKQVIDYQ